MKERDIHIHFPAGAVPKDGPSAGVTLVTALVSLFAKRSVRADTAMTGEMTLRGLVLPVGGIKDKILAAHRCGIRRVILPERNRKDLQEVPAAILKNMEVCDDFSSLSPELSTQSDFHLDEVFKYFILLSIFAAVIDDIDIFCDIDYTRQADGGRVESSFRGRLSMEACHIAFVALTIYLCIHMSHLPTSLLVMSLSSHIKSS